ncbi:hypothetical protein ACFLUK_02025 [Chloroflexota bacterium]
MSEPGYEVVWPRGKKVVEGVRLAERLDTLEGKTVCNLWDLVFRGDEIFPVIERELTKQYPGIKFVGYKEFGSIHGSEEKDVLAALPDKFKQNKCDAIICGVGC